MRDISSKMSRIQTTPAPIVLIDMRWPKHVDPPGEIGYRCRDMRMVIMTMPMWMLLGFATWTLLLLTATVGVYRWVKILLCGAPIASFRSDQLEGEDWYRRGTRAHANCVENLPVFGAIVLVISATGVAGPAVNYLCVIVLMARVCQSLVHVSHVQTDAFVAVRFSFFCVQLVCFFALIAIAACHGV